MGFVVKNTTFYGPLDLVCPHRCKGCGELGRLLCGCCKKYIESNAWRRCVMCGGIVENFWLCGKCVEKSELDGLLAVGLREGLLAEVVKSYKYGPVRGLACDLAEMVGDSLVEGLSCSTGLKEGPEGDYSGGLEGLEVVIVPLPTIGRHIRERGFDHTLLLAKKVARRCGIKVERSLERNNDAVQVGATEYERIKQAKTAYKCVCEVRDNIVYVLLDDVWTTGASMEAAARELRGKNQNAKIIGMVIEVPRRDDDR